MKLLKSLLVVSIMLGTTAVSADIESDVQSQLPMQQIFNNAFESQTNLADIFQQIGSADATQTPAATSYATCEKLDAVVTILNLAFVAAPELAEEIANAARECGATEEELLTSALASGIDPTTIGEATAAGGAPAPVNTIIAPATFGNSVGTGGGGTGSDS